MRMRAQHRKFLADERRSLVRARVIIANSQRTKNDLVTLLGLAEESMRMIYYGTESDVFHPPTPQARLSARDALRMPEHRLKAIFIGALGDRRKGFDILISAWRQLCSDPIWDVDLAVVGAGAELPAWRSLTDADPLLKGRIEFLGFRQDVPRILAAADLLVAPPRYEAYGLGVHEALCCGVPAIVSRNAGVAERYPTQLTDFLLADPPSDLDLISRLRARRRSREFMLPPSLHSRRSSARDLGKTCRERSSKLRSAAQEFCQQYPSNGRKLPTRH